MTEEKQYGNGKAPCSSDVALGVVIAGCDPEAEVFAAGDGGVNFRTVGWLKAAIFLLKMTFAAGVLSIPAALYTLGAVAGAIFIFFWGVLNTYMAYIQGQFKLTHSSVHTVTDAAYIAALDLSNGSKRTAFSIKEVTDVLCKFEHAKQ